MPLFREGCTTFRLSDRSDRSDMATFGCEWGWGLGSGWSLTQLSMGSFPMEGDDRHGGREEGCAFLMSIQEPGRSDFQEVGL